MDPLRLDTPQQCAYILKCIEAEMEPGQILESKFRGDTFTFNLLMTILIEKGWAGKDKKSGKWFVRR